MAKLDLGCGLRKRDGHIGVDRRPLPGVDVVADLEGTLPFRTGSIDSVFSNHTFEHVRDLIGLMQEIHRICRPDAQVEVSVPYYTSEGATKDPTHVRAFSEGTFEYFTGRKDYGSDYGIGCRFDIVSIKYLYRGVFRYLPFRTWLRRHLWNTTWSMTVLLRIVKDE